MLKIDLTSISLKMGFVPLLYANQDNDGVASWRKTYELLEWTAGTRRLRTEKKGDKSLSAAVSRNDLESRMNE